MRQHDRSARRRDEELRLEAAAWFARLRGPEAQRHLEDFEAWRKADPKRQAVYDRLVRRWDDAAVLVGAQASLRITGSRRRRRPPWPRGAPWRAAASVACAGFAVVVLAPARPDWLDRWPVPSVWSQRLATRVGEIRTWRLADGSSVTLDTDTVLRSQYSAADRRLRLMQGRARFDVAQDPARPFLVAAGGGVVAARGTLFDVALSSDQRVAVTLLRGVIDVDPTAEVGTPRRAATRLVPGQQVAFGRTLPPPRVEPASPTGSMWPSGLLAFARTPLSQAVADANRYSRRRIVLAEPSLGDLQVSGVFRATAPHDLAEGLAAVFDLRLAAAPDGDFILSRPSSPSPSGTRPAG